MFHRFARFVIPIPFANCLISVCQESTPCSNQCHPLPQKTISLNSGNVVFASEIHRNDGKVQLLPMYDVAIIGAGVVGCAIAYRLSLLQGIRTILIDENLDVGEGTSKGNSAIIHTGFDAEPNSLESQLLQESSVEWPILAKQLKIPYNSVGALLVAITDAELGKLKDVITKARKNNVFDYTVLSKEEIIKLEPNVSSDVHGGILIPREAIADPFAAPIAYAEVAVQNGVDICFGAKVHSISSSSRTTSLHLSRQHRFNTISISPSTKDCPVSPSSSAECLTLKAKHVINASGLGSRLLAESYDEDIANQLDINPRRGQFYVLQDGSIVNRIILPMPNEVTKGILVCPTIFGNTLCGPTAEDLPYSTFQDPPIVTSSGLNEVRRGAISLVPAVLNAQTVTTYAGHRCNRKSGSYFVYHDFGKGITTISGIRSTGLSSSPAFSRMIVDHLFPNHPIRRDAIQYRSHYPSWYNHNVYGKDFVCSYEKVTEQDIRKAIHSPLRPHTFDSIKRRTRVLMGACQGSDCQERLAEIIAEETGLKTITKCGCQSVSFDVPS